MLLTWRQLRAAPYLVGASWLLPTSEARLRAARGLHPEPPAGPGPPAVAVAQHLDGQGGGPGRGRGALRDRGVVHDDHFKVGPVLTIHVREQRDHAIAGPYETSPCATDDRDAAGIIPPARSGRRLQQVQSGLILISCWTQFL